MAERIVNLLRLEVIEAKNLPAMDVGGQSDPYCKIDFGSVGFRTHTILKNKDHPVWNSVFNIPIRQTETKYNLDIGVYDFDKLTTDDFIGNATLDLATLADLKERDLWLPVNTSKKSSAQLHVKAKLKDHKEVERDFWLGFAESFDSSGDGTISPLEFRSMMAGIDPSLKDDQIDAFFVKADKNGDHEISFEEFFAWVSGEGKQEMEEHVLPKENPDFIWQVCVHAAKAADIGGIVLEGTCFGKEEPRHRQSSEGEITVQDRETGKLVIEKIPQSIKLAIRMMYGTTSGRFAVDNSQIKKLLKKMTTNQGKKYNDPESKKEIPAFIQYHNLDVEEIKKDLNSFNNFNEFFYRELKPGFRVIAEPKDDRVAVSGADCRLMAFENISKATEVWVKGRNFSVRQLLQDEALANKFDGGSLVIHRLAPQDYHRFHSPVTGKYSAPVHHTGCFYTVNPIAINSEVDVYLENTRAVCVVDTAHFGEVAYICVGATLVGSINFTYAPGATIKKGDEVGYFAFGGSTVLTLFKRGTIKFDDDLLINSSKPLETLVKVGSRLGVATGAK